MQQKPMLLKRLTKVNTINTSRFVLKTQYNTDKLNLGNKIIDTYKKMPDTSRSVDKNIW